MYKIQVSSYIQGWNFTLLMWNQYHASCRLSLTDFCCLTICSWSWYLCPSWLSTCRSRLEIWSSLGMQLLSWYVKFCHSSNSFMLLKMSRLITIKFQIYIAADDPNAMYLRVYLSTLDFDSLLPKQ